MEFFEAVSKRRTVRQFRPDGAPPESVKRALAAEGLYGCTYTPYEAEGLKQFLGVPPGFEVAAVIPFGFPAGEPGEGTPESLDDRLFADAWGNPAVL